MHNLFTHANPSKSEKVDIDIDDLQNRKSREAKMGFCCFMYRNDVFNFCSALQTYYQFHPTFQYEKENEAINYKPT